MKEGEGNEMIAKLIEAGPDWLTATSQSQQSADLMADVWHQISTDDGGERIRLHNASWFGYFGKRSEHMFYGMREEQACIIISSHIARIWAQEVYEVGGRPSRLDLQATFEIADISREIEQMYDEACKWKPPTGRPAKVTALKGRDKEYETLYVGRRASEVFIRCYNKAKESKDPYYQDCLRFEVELKSHTARTVAGELQRSDWSLSATLGIIKGYLLRYGIQPSAFDLLDPVVMPTKRVKTSTEGKMAWLLQQVSPTIQALIEEVGWEAVASVLFPDGLTTHTSDDRIDA